MRYSGLVVSSVAAFVSAVALPAARCAAQYQAPSEKLVMAGRTATTWTDGRTDVVQLEGPVALELDTATLTAKQAVLWISPDPDHPDTKRVQVALIGEAKVQNGAVARTGERILVTAEVAGRIQLRAEERYDLPSRDSALYRLAEQMRNPPAAATAPPGVAPAPAPPVAPNSPTTDVGVAPRPPRPAVGPSTTSASGPTTSTTSPATTAAAPPPPPGAPFSTGAVAPIGPLVPVLFQAPQLETLDGDDGHVVVVLTNGVTLFQQRPTGDLIELQAQRVVLFTTLKSLRDLNKPEQTKRIQDSIAGAYLEGDVRIVFTPGKGPYGEQRMLAERVYYDFNTDRAMLTDAVIQTIEPKGQIPVTLRAKVVRQLAQGEYKADGIKLSTSAFATPSYGIAARKVYVRQEPGDFDDPARVLFQADDTTFRLFGVPVFYLPRVSGSMTSNESIVRALSVGHSNALGVHAEGEFGLFETLGLPAPRDLDLSYRLGYYSDRGPVFGLDGRYKGGFITDATREPWSFEGEFHSFFVNDHGSDDIGRPTTPRDQTDLRGAALYEHQHYFPDGWQFQLRAGYLSDQEFLEQYLPRQFDQELPHDVSLYLKHQKDTEAYTLLLQFQPNDLVTTSDLLQEQFEVEHLPEFTYRRIGDSLFDDRATFFSDNSVAGLHFQRTRETLAQEGFVGGFNPGFPSLGLTGVTDDVVYRGDFRQEFDFPFQAGNFKVVPYLLGRYTVYSDSPDGGAKNRLYAGAGARVSTAFWKTDDTVESDLFDLHRLRHVIEPQLNLFTSAQTVDRKDVFIYEEQTDPINDITAAQIALRQRWQTYRGGPGRWRSVDFFTLNVEANLFANQPSAAQLNPYGFRGLFFPSLPETSVPRNSVNVDAEWRISDSTVVLADASENLDKTKLATASVGLVARRGDHLVYYVGTRYIADLHSNITTAAVEYELTRKYTVQLAQSFDFGLGQNVSSELGIIRRFDSFFVAFKAYRNETTDQNGFGVNIYPNGLGYGLDSGQFSGVLNTRR